LVVTNADTNTLSILLGNGDGSFRPYADLITGAAPHTIALADLTGDDRIDIVVGNRRSNSVSVFLNKAPNETVSANWRK
jgi:hypothetical protein